MHPCHRNIHTTRLGDPKHHPVSTTRWYLGTTQHGTSAQTRLASSKTFWVSTTCIGIRMSTNHHRHTTRRTYLLVSTTTILGTTKASFGIPGRALDVPMGVWILQHMDTQTSTYTCKNAWRHGYTSKHSHERTRTNTKTIILEKLFLIYPLHNIK